MTAGRYGIYLHDSTAVRHPSLRIAVCAEAFEADEQLIQASLLLLHLKQGAKGGRGAGGPGEECVGAGSAR